jgi:DNA-binding winged helix-turn-helix (wHTH) protein/tetratricopeptide (TPR) repeat protein
MAWGLSPPGRRRSDPGRSQDRAIRLVPEPEGGRGAKATGLAPGPIVLAHEPTFELAGLEVRPQSLEAIFQGRSEALEPRVMQVLVALARCRGEMVSRNDLIQACWGGRVVGDDAINRCIARIRKLAKLAGGFEVQTVPRVGFRLAETTAAAATQPSPWRPRLSRRMVIAVGAFAVLALVAFGAWTWRDAWPGGSPPSLRVAVEPFRAVGSDAAARDFAARLSDQTTGVLKESVVGVSLVDPAAPFNRSDLRLSGTVSREAGNWRVRATLEDARRQVTLWSQTFRRPVGDVPALETEAPVAAAEVVADAVDVLRENGAWRDPQALALYLQSAAAIRSPVLMNLGDPRRLLEEAVAREPEFVGARSLLAFTLIGGSLHDPVGEREQNLRRGQQEAESAIREEPAAAGSAYGARYLLARLRTPHNHAAAEDILTEGLKKAPRFSYLHMFKCRFLVEVGRSHDAISSCQRALALNPLASPLAYRYAESLYAGGSPERARAAVDRGVRLHPEHEETRRIQFEIEAFSGSPDAAAALLHRPQETPCNCAPATPEGIAAMDLYLKARKSGAAADADRAISALTTAVRQRRLQPRYLVFGAAALGRLDEAFAMLNRIAGFDRRMLMGESGLLLEGPAAPLWRDTRFWPLAAKAGYVEYWRKRGVWPDFCNDPALPYDCRVHADRAAVE